MSSFFENSCVEGKNFYCPNELQISLYEGDFSQMIEKSNSFTNSGLAFCYYSISRKGYTLVFLNYIFLIKVGLFVSPSSNYLPILELLPSMLRFLGLNTPSMKFYCRLQSNIYFYQHTLYLVIKLLNFYRSTIMKLDKILEDTIKIKINPRKPIFFTRVKMFIWGASDEWIQNCRGLLILYTLNSLHYITIMNISNFQIDFDMELFTNFLNYTKWLGETKSLHFVIPCQGEKIMAVLVLQSKQQLTQLKSKLETEFYKSDNSKQLQFFQRPQVQELIKEADISPEALETKLKFRNDIQNEIKAYFSDLDQLEKKTKNSGFKAYGLGREQWKLEQSQKQFVKQKKRSELLALLGRLNKQSKML